MSFNFTQIFGGNTVYPVQPTFLSLVPLSASIILQWPLEQTPAGVQTVADIVEVNATTGGLAVSLSDARQTSTGYTALFNNVGANTFNVLDASGNVLAVITSGTVWQLYLADNSTLNGTWRVFQYGAGVSNANAAALAGAGLKAITTTLNEKISISTKSIDYVIVNGDRAGCIEWTGGNGTFTLPDPATVGSDWFCLVKNAGTGSLTVTPPSGQIDAQASLIFNPENSAFVICDGVNFITVGLGQALNSIFDFDSIDVSGTGNYVLAGANLNRISYRFTGVLTGNRIIIVPTTVQQYWVDNETTGPFGLTVKTAAGTGTSVWQGARNILYCDGTNVVAAVTFSSTGFPDGSAASPSVTFASHPTTGMYLVGADILGLSTAGTERLQIDAHGHTLFESPDTAGPTATINSSIPGINTLITTASGQTSAAPALVVKSTAAGGFSFLSIVGNNGTSGTNDLSIFQDGSTGDAQILNRHTTGHLKLGAHATVGIDIDPTGLVSIPVAIEAPSTGAPILYDVTAGVVSGFGFTATGPFIRADAVLTSNDFLFEGDGVNNLALLNTSRALRYASGTNPLYTDGPIQVSFAGGGGTTGLKISSLNGGTANAGGAALPANPVGFFIWNLNGTVVKVPYYAN